MNEFSILCRVLGSLYYRQPQDPLLVPLFTLIREGKLAANWPLEQDELLTRLQKSCDMAQVSAITMRCLSAMNVPCRHIVAHGLRTQRKRKCALFFPNEGCHWRIRQPITSAHCCLRLPGWKISQRKMRAKHWKHCSVSICYPGVVRSSAKWRPMQPRLSGAPWHR